MAEKYNEYKVRTGEQERLEDAELPDDLHDENVFNQLKLLHEEQRNTPENREKRSKKVLELIKIHDEIIEMREKAQANEWEAEKIERKNKLECTQRVIQRKKEELQLKQDEEQQMKEIQELNMWEKKLQKQSIREKIP